MRHKQLLICIFTILACFLSFSEGKVSKCKDVINKHDKDFFYCTKFSVGKGQAFMSLIRAKFTRSLSVAASSHQTENLNNV